jgi:DNA helicase II / ATP-dependent DNA helicase PcrA
MDKLNEQQQLAVDTVNGPILILAGAGSGKTKVLTHRIASLLEKKLAQPENILAVTFTNKAANEMKSRVYKLLNPHSHEFWDPKSYQSRIFMPWMGTFHAICVRILKAHTDILGLNPNFTIYDANDQVDAVKEVLKKLGLSDKKFNPRGILSQISSAKNELITPEKYLTLAQGFMQEIVGQVYPEYQKILKDNSALDFDDLLTKTVDLLEQFPKVLEKFQDLFKFILIDEYQDTNLVQYRFANLLAAKTRNICVVGDDAQSIYGFRGANIQNILNFERDYPDAKVIKLEQNYRSTKKILNASNEIISLNRNQKPKTMWTKNDEGDQLSLYEAQNEKDEALWIGRKIKELTDNGANANEIAILYRTNAQSRTLEEGLLSMGLNYRVVGGLKFYSRREIKDMIAYLRLLFNRQDNLSLYRIINVPKRGIGEKKLQSLQESASRKQKMVLPYLLELTNEEAEQELEKNVQEFRTVMQKLVEVSTTLNVTELIKETLRLSGYLEMLNDGTTENEARVENLKEMLSVAQKYDQMDSHTGLETFLNEVALIEQETEAEDIETDRVTLMTIHAAKGLEFEYVFIAGMEEGLFPHSRSYVDPAEMEEERRLAYVALTRAKKKLYLTYTQSRVYFGNINSNPVSRFVTDIPEELLFYEDPMGSGLGKDGWSKFDSDDAEAAINAAFSPKIELHKGDTVRHPTFGVGMVEDINDDTVVIRFSIGKKELALEYVQLQKL